MSFFPLGLPLVDGDAGVNGDVDDGEGLVRADEEGLEVGANGGMGRIHIRSLSRLCWDSQG